MAARASKAPSQKKKAILRTEERDPVIGVTATRLAALFDEEGFGTFAVLESGAGHFIQTACEWEASAVTSAFLRKHKADPWVVEYRDNASAPIFRVKKHLTLAQVKVAFLSWLAGDDAWRTAHRWKVLEL